MPKKNSLFPRSLFVVHRSVFKSKLRVRKATVADTPNIVLLIESLYEAPKVMNDYETSLLEGMNPKSLSCYVTEVLTHEMLPIIGLMIVR